MTQKEIEKKNMEIINYYLNSKNYLTMADLGEKFGCTKQNISLILKSHNIEIKKRYSQSELIEDYKEGKSLNEIAEKYGIHTATVRGVLNQNGVSVKSATTISKVLDRLEDVDTENKTLPELYEICKDIVEDKVRLDNILRLKHINIKGIKGGMRKRRHYE